MDNIYHIVKLIFTTSFNKSRLLDIKKANFGVYFVTSTTHEVQWYMAKALQCKVAVCYEAFPRLSEFYTTCTICLLA